MQSERHVTGRLQAFLDGRLDDAQATEVGDHLASCAACAEERELLRDVRALLGRNASAGVEPRSGFAFKVALAASEARAARPAFSWRWAFGGIAGTALAAGLVIAVVPRQPLNGGSSHEMLLAQRLDLYEDLSVMQNREALENLEVVEQLDKLELGKP